MMFLLLCLTSFSMLISRSNHVAANNIISFFLMTELNSIVCVYIYIYTHTTSLLVPLLMDI